ncbi:hypothetical protein FKO37_14725 [Amycolatopsis sp. Poz14]|nr:hypothetical protein [Amycolatopsis sp. Poz14]
MTFIRLAALISPIRHTSAASWSSSYARRRPALVSADRRELPRLVQPGWHADDDVHPVGRVDQSDQAYQRGELVVVVCPAAARARVS